MGQVYRATDLKLHRRVALKFLPPQLNDNTQKERFLQEARAASALDHPNIGTIHAIDETGDGQTFIVMALRQIARKVLRQIICKVTSPVKPLAAAM
jgi:serine/threonine-protein kinase